MREEAMELLAEQKPGPSQRRDSRLLCPTASSGGWRSPELWPPDPKLLLLDEPAAGMNPQETQELGEYIVELRKNHDLTILMIEHHMDLVMQFSDRIYVIDFGKLISSGTPDVVKADRRVIDAYLGVVE